MRLLTTFFSLWLFAGTLAAQAPSRPKLVIGITIDQMRYDYLYRYASQYGTDGFNRLLKEGLSFENTHYDYIPTYTAPGHACIYTGTGPAGNGIIGNEWWDPEWNAKRYVTSDKRYRTVGAEGKSGQHSPSVLLSTTVTDELRLATNFRSKVVGICIKDRGSILPAGHIPNASYWFDDQTGHWITSSYYPDSLGLPEWVQAFNNRKLPETYCSQVWDRLPGVTYEQSFADWKKYDRGRYAVSLTGGFPHNLPAIRKKMGLGVIRFTPFANTLTVDFALEAIQQMQLGEDNFPDLLALSFSAPDYGGHQFGIHAEEVEDIYLRLDREIARLLNFIDQRYGKDQVLIFLSADHGGGETPAHLKDIRIPADVFPESTLDSALTAHFKRVFSTELPLVKSVMNQMIWLNHPTIDSLGLELPKVIKAAKDFIQKMPGVYSVYSASDILQLPADIPPIAGLRKGFYPKRSGDLFFQLDPNWHPDDQAFLYGGATHGSSYAYDTHVPLLWYGAGVKAGKSYQATAVSDIAPTLSAFLKIMEPSASTGKVLERVFER
ncbi:MAG: alkaline phosphatase family protein [Chitinophagales bacterium]|jgi:hypothetical protein